MNDLAVRQSQRHDVALRGSVQVDPEHIAIVRLSKTSGAREGTLPVDIVDLSSKGLGFLVPVFFPKGLNVVISVIDPKGGVPLLSIRGKVMRTIMTDRRPMYLIGVSIETPEGETKKALDAILASFEELA